MLFLLYYALFLLMLHYVISFENDLCALSLEVQQRVDFSLILVHSVETLV